MPSKAQRMLTLALKAAGTVLMIVGVAWWINPDMTGQILVEIFGHLEKAE